MSKSKAIQKFVELAAPTQPQEVKRSNPALAILPPPPEEKEERKIKYNLSLDPRIVREVDKVARSLGYSRSNLVETILSRYLDLERAARPELFEEKPPSL